MDPLEALLKTEDLANYLKVDVVTVRRLVNRGELAAYRIGGEYRFKARDVITRITNGHGATTNISYQSLTSMHHPSIVSPRDAVLVTTSTVLVCRLIAEDEQKNRWRLERRGHTRSHPEHGR